MHPSYELSGQGHADPAVASAPAQNNGDYSKLGAATPRHLQQVQQVQPAKPIQTAVKNLYRPSTPYPLFLRSTP